MLDRTTPPPVANFSDITIHPQQIHTLNNGIDIHIVNKGDFPLSRIDVLWDGGTLDYASEAAATVMTAAMREGTLNLSGAEIANIVDFSGSKMNGGLSNHHASLGIVTLNSRLENMMGLLADIAVGADFPENAVEAIGRRLGANRSLQFERVSFRATSLLQSLLQGKNHSASKIAMPLEFESVNREICESLYDTLRRSKIHIFAGGLIGDDVVDAIDKTFGKLPHSDYSPIRIHPYEPEKPQRQHVDMPHALQSAVAMGLPAIDRTHPDYIPLRLTVMALGGFFGSRLMTNIREEKGLTYGISSSLLGTQEGAFMEISAQCDKKYVDTVIEETLYEIENLSKNPPRGDELNRLKLHAWTILASSTENAFSTLEHYITQLRVGTPTDYFRQQLKAIADLTPDTISRMASEYLPTDRLSIVTAG